MSLEKMSTHWSVNDVSNKVRNNTIDFDHIVQRSYVWERARKTAFKPSKAN